MVRALLVAGDNYNPPELTMKTLILAVAFLGAATFAKADFTSYTLTSQTDPLKYTPTVSYTFDSLSINMTGNTPAGKSNPDTNQNPSAVANDIISLSFTDNASIVGDKFEVTWLFPTATSVFETFSGLTVPGSVDLGQGLGDFTVSGNTVTITNTLNGFGAASYNGFEVLDLTREAEGSSCAQTGKVPDSGSTLALVGGALAALFLLRSRLSFGAAK